MKKLAIMQPYFLPYIGYWQLINAVDEFVVYDNIEFTKKGWINRNRILNGDGDRLFTIPLKSDSDFLNVDQRFLSPDSDKEIERTLRIIKSVYKKAPFFEEAYPVIEECFKYSTKNLFSYIYNSIKLICKYLDIKTQIIISSEIAVEHSLKAEKKVITICNALDADGYVNTAGGQEIYNKKEFADNGIELKFIKPKNISYKQFDNEYSPWLSIIDVMMFNDKETIAAMLEEYELV